MDSLKSLSKAKEDSDNAERLKRTRVVIKPCRFTTYRHRFARAAPAPRAKRGRAWTCVDVRGRAWTCVDVRGRASPVKSNPKM